VEEDDVIRWPHHRKIIAQIISGELTKLGTSDVAKVNDFIELYSAPPLSTGRNHAHSFPEPDALRVIIRVTKFEKGEGEAPSFVHWKNFVEKSEPDPSRDGEEIERVILRALNDIGGDAGVFTPSKILAEATGIPVQGVEDHLELLAEQKKVEYVVSSTGSAAYMKPKGRIYLKEVAMATKQSIPTPRLAILLTWSGSTSHNIATVFHTWLPSVIPGTQPWISDEDIAKGMKWFPVLMEQLSKTDFSIVFVTAENVRSPWIYFEVGGIAREVKHGIVCPYLVGVDGQQISSGPLGQFQWTEATRADTLKLIKSINNALKDQAHDEQSLKSKFKDQWPKLERQISRVLESSAQVEGEVDEVEPSIEQRRNP
jgi:hypothetical protein